jgi:hypothetical protein
LSYTAERDLAGCTPSKLIVAGPASKEPGLAKFRPDLQPGATLSTTVFPQLSLRAGSRGPLARREDRGLSPFALMSSEWIPCGKTLTGNPGGEASERLIAERLRMSGVDRQKIASRVCAGLDTILKLRPDDVVSFYWKFRGELKFAVGSFAFWTEGSGRHFPSSPEKGIRWCSGCGLPIAGWSAGFGIFLSPLTRRL